MIWRIKYVLFKLLLNKIVSSEVTLFYITGKKRFIIKKIFPSTKRKMEKCVFIYLFCCKQWKKKNRNFFFKLLLLYIKKNTCAVWKYFWQKMVAMPNKMYMILEIRTIIWKKKEQMKKIIPELFQNMLKFIWKKLKNIRNFTDKLPLICLKEELCLKKGKHDKINKI